MGRACPGWSESVCCGKAKSVTSSVKSGTCGTLVGAGGGTGGAACVNGTADIVRGPVVVVRGCASTLFWRATVEVTAGAGVEAGPGVVVGWTGDVRTAVSVLAGQASRAKDSPIASAVVDVVVVVGGVVGGGVVGGNVLDVTSEGTTGAADVEVRAAEGGGS